MSAQRTSFSICYNSSDYLWTKRSRIIGDLSIVWLFLITIILCVLFFNLLFLFFVFNCHSSDLVSMNIIRDGVQQRWIGLDYRIWRLFFSILEHSASLRFDAMRVSNTNNARHLVQARVQARAWVQHQNILLSLLIYLSNIFNKILIHQLIHQPLL